MLSTLEVRRRLPDTRERVDVFDALAWLDVRVVFKPLDGLLGAFVGGERPGVVITTRRPPSVQRFTAAHELGHAILGHSPSLDTEESLGLAASGSAVPRPRGFASQLQEVEADAFAGSFLLPLWLITSHARRQGWSRASLLHEDLVYQLALRCGASFQATVWALERHGFIGSGDRARLLAVRPKSIKARLGHHPPVADARSDAWRISPTDVGLAIPVAVGDTVSVGDDQSPGRLTETIGGVLEAAGQGSAAGVLFRAPAPGLTRLRMEAGDVGTPLVAGEPAALFVDVVVEARESGLSRANRARMRPGAGPSGLPRAA